MCFELSDFTFPWKWKYQLLSHVWPFATPWTVACPWGSPGKNTRMDCHALLQGIFPTQGLNLGLLYCRQILHHLATREALFFNGCIFISKLKKKKNKLKTTDGCYVRAFSLSSSRQLVFANRKWAQNDAKEKQRCQRKSEREQKISSTPEYRVKIT